MKNRFIVIYTVFAAAVFIFSISYFGYNLYNEYSTNVENADKKFSELESSIRSLSKNYSENTESYSDTIKAAIKDPLDYSYIHVRRANETVVLYPTGKSKEETTSKLTKAFSKSFTENNKKVELDFNLYLIRPDSIFYYARVSFLMILIITIITIIMIIYLNISETSSQVISLEEDDDNTDSLAEEDDDSEAESSEEDINDSAKEIPDMFEEEEKAEENSEEEKESDEVKETSQDISENENTSEAAAENNTEDEEEKHTEVTPEEVKAIFAEPLTDQETSASSYSESAKLPIDEVTPAPLEEVIKDSSQNEPSGLFDPATGIGWESYLITRLNNEIDRATASEIDLSLFIIQLSGIDKNSEVFKNVCNYLAIQFQFKDMLFEHKQDCIVAIKISMNVDEALKLADKLYSDICNIINGKNCRIGVSSRSIRMLTGDRLILEAEQAIEHSDEKSPVIAFRVDSEKYRQLMEQNQA